MSWEDELRALASERETAGGSVPSQLMIDHPANLRRQLRHYLGVQADLGRLKKTYDGPTMDTREGGVQELVCDGVEFWSDSRLTFYIKLRQEQAGWHVKEFEFHLHLVSRTVGMVRVHLNDYQSDPRRIDPLRIPRCHFHIGDSEAHIPFPQMSCRLILHLLCEYIEPDLGASRSPE